MTDIVYWNGTYLPKSEVRVSPDDRGWLFGDGVYEVTPLYNGRFVELERHIARLERNLRELRIEPVDAHDWRAIAREVAARNNLRDTNEAIVYMQATRGAAPRRHAFPSPPVAPTGYAYAAPFPARPDPDAGCAAITVTDTRWARCDIKTIALVANVLANQQAKEAGAYEAIFVRDGMVLEGTHSNVFAVIDGEVCTAPLSNQILPGITRGVVLEVCRAERIPVCEAPLPEGTFQRAQEVFLTGTTTEVLPVVRINDKPVGNGMVGNLTRRLRKLYLAGASK